MADEHILRMLAVLWLIVGLLILCLTFGLEDFVEVLIVFFSVCCWIAAGGYLTAIVVRSSEP